MKTYPVRNHDTKGDSELLKSNERTTNFRRGQLGIVEGYNHGERSDTKTSNKPV